MLIKYLNKGRGDAQEAADYLMGDYDWSGEKRKEVSVLYGSPNLVAKVANSLTSPNVYTSGVVAWAVTDKPTDQQILEAMYLWRLLAFAGLDIERLSMVGQILMIPCGPDFYSQDHAFMSISRGSEKVLNLKQTREA